MHLCSGRVCVALLYNFSGKNEVAKFEGADANTVFLLRFNIAQLLTVE